MTTTSPRATSDSGYGSGSSPTLPQKQFGALEPASTLLSSIPSPPPSSLEFNLSELNFEYTDIDQFIGLALQQTGKQYKLRYWERGVTLELKMVATVHEIASQALLMFTIRLMREELYNNLMIEGSGRTEWTNARGDIVVAKEADASYGSLPLDGSPMRIGGNHPLVVVECANSGSATKLRRDGRIWGYRPDEDARRRTSAIILINLQESPADPTLPEITIHLLSRDELAPYFTTRSTLDPVEVNHYPAERLTVVGRWSWTPNLSSTDGSDSPAVPFSIPAFVFVQEADRHSPPPPASEIQVDMTEQYTLDKIGMSKYGRKVASHWKLGRCEWHRSSSLVPGIALPLSCQAASTGSGSHSPTLHRAIFPYTTAL